MRERLNHLLASPFRHHRVGIIPNPNTSTRWVGESCSTDRLISTSKEFHHVVDAGNRIVLYYATVWRNYIIKLGRQTDEWADAFGQIS